MRRAFFFLVLPFLLHCGDDDTSGGDPGGTGQGGAGASSTTGAGAGLSLDTAFGDDGVLHTDRGFSSALIYSAARLSDGSIVAAGTNYGLANVSESIVVRFDPSGAPDASFGQEGMVVVTVGEFAWITEVQPAASGVLVSGYAFEGIDARTFVVRLDASGQVDPTFADGGVLRVPNDYGRPWLTMAQSSDGDIALLSRVDSFTLSLTRFDANGTPIDDPLPIDDEEPRALAFVGDDLLVLSGDDDAGNLRRVTASGTLDSGFGSAGSVALDFTPYCLAVAGDGTIWVGGGPNTLLALNDDGTPNTAVGANGIVAFDFGYGSGYEAVSALTVTSDGIVVVGAQIGALPNRSYLGMAKVDVTGAPLAFDDTLNGVLDGTSFQQGVADVGVAGSGLWIAGHRTFTNAQPPEMDESEAFAMMLGADGTVDESYGEQGLAHRTASAPETLWSFSPDPAGGFVVHGAEGGIANRGLLMRLDGGAMDSTFSGDGYARLPMAGAAVVATDQRFYVGGGLGLTVMATDHDGVLDPTFGMNGTTVFMIGETPGLVLDLALDPRGRLMVMGEAGGGGAYLARLLDDGSLDPSYGEGGVVLDPSGAGGFVGAGLTKADGAMVLAGQRTFDDSWIGKVDATGAPDASFGNGGFTVIGEAVRIFRLIELADGGHLAAGYSKDCYAVEDVCNLVLARVDASGALDASFGTGGLVHLESAFYFLWAALAELPDGSLVAGGATESDAYDTPFTLWKLRADGSIDSGFGTDGAFVLPGKGRAIEATINGDRLLIGGYLTTVDRGSHMVFLQFTM